jgi:hypothetical protein
MGKRSLKRKRSYLKGVRLEVKKGAEGAANLFTRRTFPVVGGHRPNRKIKLINPCTIKPPIGKFEL